MKRVVKYLGVKVEISSLKGCSHSSAYGKVQSVLSSETDKTDDTVLDSVLCSVGPLCSWGQPNIKKEDGRRELSGIERIGATDSDNFEIRNDRIENFLLSLQQLMTLSIHQLERGSNRKFEIANQNGLEKYILQVKLIPLLSLLCAHDLASVFYLIILKVTQRIKPLLVWCDTHSIFLSVITGSFKRNERWLVFRNK